MEHRAKCTEQSVGHLFHVTSYYRIHRKKEKGNAMKWIAKMERKYGRYAIHNLSAYIIALYAAGYLMQVLSPQIFGYLTLEPRDILRGQIWRLVSWVLIPPDSLDLFTILMLYFYYSVGTALERTWGAFRYNLYIFSGILFTVIGAFVLYGILRAMYAPAVPSLGSAFSTYYISMSILLAFSVTYPDMQVMLMFFIPIKMKWLGVFYGVLMVFSFLQSGWPSRVVMLASLLNFLVFFLGTRDWKRYSYKEQQRKREFHKAVAPTRVKRAASEARHKCAVCGRTEKDGANLEFRFCSKCDGNYEYCQDHLFTHEHVKAGGR